LTSEPARCRVHAGIDHTVLGAIATPSPLELALDRPLAPGWVVLGQADHEVTNLCVLGRSLRGTKTRSRVRPGPIQATQGAAP